MTVYVLPDFISSLSDIPIKVVITTDMYSKKTDTYQYLSPDSCHPKIQIKNTLIGLADKIRRNCSDNIINDITYKKD